MIIAAVKVLEERGDKERADLLRNTYLSYKEPASLLHKTKLKLNRNNENVYALQLLQLQIPTYTAGLKPSEKRLIGAFKYFSAEISKLFKDDSTESIAAFISKKVDEKLFFTSIIVGDDIDAYKVFETLNARGVKLSTADLLKNYLFSKVYARSALRGCPNCHLARACSNRHTILCFKAHGASTNNPGRFAEAKIGLVARPYRWLLSFHRCGKR